MPTKPNTLSYNVTWSTRVFSSRAATESLLAPEHEDGNLTTNDYNASLHFLPGYHRYYPIVGVLIATAPLALRTRKWSSRRALTAFTLGFTGHLFGKLTVLNAHYNYVRSLENPAGFSKAMQNIQAKLGGPVPQGFIIERAYEPSPDDQNETISSDSLSTNQQTNQPLNQSPLTKWDQIRKMNDNTAKNSSWDSIRQKHERSSSIVKSPSSDQGSELFWDDAANSDLDNAPTQ
ncbi:hypothetical protein CPB84DRAFT_1759401 [Gymnopilus junonius]|uniref:Uncharacterized protein n=1 Tax=Gymnopilus junonius TaxID=109634 RepID=A0A9P5P1G0_GYMJU|nr:hypothetical protein CPB84DRAFT_1759401 [Gymnopilus junonius]